MMSEGRAGVLLMSEENIAVLVKMLIEAMDTNPGLAAEFIRKRVGKKIESWVNHGVEGAATLVSRLVPYMEKQAAEVGGMGIEFF